MNEYNDIFNSKTIYNYPFSDNINTFLVLGWIDINILKKDDFNALINILNGKVNKIFINFISKEGNIIDKKVYNFYEFNYEIYKIDCLGKGDYNIYFDNFYMGISFSEEFFCLIGGDKKNINIFLELIGNDYFNRLNYFIEEWEGNKKGNWSYELLNRQNYYKKYLAPIKNN